ncbi:uncharacterized protein LOC143285134 [Babylonia areolata]|uniref:uncharacterized protein LOC143285134 n=1 Tax=Babylonia areolata TaxID=304850 RepID=UPI003FD582D3
MTAVMGYGHVIWLWTTWLYVAAHIRAEAFKVKTLTVDPAQTLCNLTQRISENEAYRIVMPEGQKCPSGGFTCAVTFSRFFLSADRYERQRNEVCVDFSRIRLKGAKTRISIIHWSLDVLRLTSSRYPLINQYMRTFKCYSHYEDKVTLMFETDCNVSGSLLLRDYFASWIYVYAQPSQRHLVYFLDGTCSHSRTFSSSSANLTIRSIYWKDTANEAKVQTCSLLVKNYGIASRRKLCTTWNFMQTSCEVSVHFKQERLMRSDYVSLRNYSCETTNLSPEDTCVPYGFQQKPVFEVVRNESTAENGTLRDGSPIFEVQAVIKMEEKRQLDNFETINTESDTYSETDYESTFATRIIFPLLGVFFSICSCVCGVSHKRSVAQQRQSARDAAVEDGTATDSGRRTAGLDSRSVGGRVSESFGTPPFRQGRDGGVDGNAAPPPAYADLDLTAPASRAGSGAGRPFLAPLDGVGEGEAGMEPPPPPPPFSDSPCGAPPAYHELFPSRA